MANKSAMPVKWHKECLKNQMAYINRHILEKNRLEAVINRLIAGTERLAEQIARAEAEGKESFDADKYNIKK